jgi:hypothetical protein
MTLDPPFWVPQRQIKVEEVGRGQWKLSGPNLPDGVLSVRIGANLRWQAVLHDHSGAERGATACEFATPADASDAAFELYRTHMIV